VAAHEALVRATACAVVDKLKSGEVTPLDLIDVLEQRIAEVDGDVMRCRRCASIGPGPARNS
jgi:amidase